MIKRRKGIRRGRVADPAYLDWMHRWPCLIAAAGFDGCSGVRTVHHVRVLGSPKNDYRTLTLCEGHHLDGFGTDAIHTLGKAKFQERFGVSLEVEILRYNGYWRDEGHEFIQCWITGSNTR